MLEDLFVRIRPGAILREVVPVKKEFCRGQPVFIFGSELCPDAKGIIFPKDEIVYLRRLYDVFVTGVREKEKGRLILTEIYHELSEGFIIPVKISGISQTGHPKFKIRGYIGYVNSRDINIGERVRVQVNAVKPSGKPELSILEASVYG